MRYNHIAPPDNGEHAGLQYGSCRHGVRQDMIPKYLKGETL